jgi:hypothetical protein
MRKLLVPILLFLLALPICARSRGSNPSHSGRAHTSRTTSTSVRKAHSPRTSSVKCLGCERDKHGHIKRSAHAKRDFQRLSPCPVTGRTSGKCPGYVIDHVRPLKRGGADDPGNMQWQTKAAAKAKDRVE